MTGRRPTGSNNEWGDGGEDEFFPPMNVDEPTLTDQQMQMMMKTGHDKSLGERVTEKAGNAVAAVVVVTFAVVVVCVCLAISIWAVKLVIP